MDDDKKTDQANQNKKSDKNIQKSRTIFTPDEVQNIVKAFVTAWITGKIEVKLESRYEIMGTARELGKTIEMQEASEKEAELKQKMLDLVEICSGTKESTEAELNQSITDLFKFILDYKGSLRIEGSFMDYSLAKKVQNLERMVEANSKVVERLISWLTDEASGNEFKM